MAKRVILFILTNILVITTISIIFSVFGVGNYITETGLDYQALFIFCLIWGIVGSLISLALSRVMAKWMMKVQVIDPNNPGAHADYLMMVHNLAKQANLPKMPEVGVYESPDVNAFATGPTKSRSLVAASTGLLNSMSRDEIEGVMAHEIAHIQNGDMVTMTLIQGVINAFVMFFARIAAYAISSRIENSGSRAMVNFICIIAFQILFGFLGMIVVGWFSRKREFRADAGSAKLAGREKMVAALEKLKQVHGKVTLQEEEHQSMAALKISDSGGKSKFKELFSTHPPLETRIAALKNFA